MNDTQHAANHSASIKRDLDFINNLTTRNDKLSWERKMNNMVDLLAKIAPIEERILDLTAEKQVIFDQITELRLTMVNECIHPYTHLVHNDQYVLCKFCDRKIVITNDETNETNSTQQ